MTRVLVFLFSVMLLLGGIFLAIGTYFYFSRNGCHDSGYSKLDKLMTKNFAIASFCGVMLFPIIILFIISLICSGPAFGEELYSETLYVITEGDCLNGRSCPSTKGFVEARFESGDEVEVVSFRNGWVEVVGGETGTVFCKEDYLSSILEPETYTNISGGSVNIRQHIGEGSDRVGKVKGNDSVVVIRKIMNWGYIRDRGWINLDYFEESAF